jgi:hypothetical protein
VVNINGKDYTITKEMVKEFKKFQKKEFGMVYLPLKASQLELCVRM